MISDAIIALVKTVVSPFFALMPTWTPNLPSLTGLINPLEQINWLVDVGLVFQTALVVLLLGPGFVAVRAVLWVVGLVTPGGTRN